MDLFINKLILTTKKFNSRIQLICVILIFPLKYVNYIKYRKY